MTELQPVIKLHLGCGKRHIHDFVHVDLADYEHIDHRCDVQRLPMFEDRSVNLVYACHVLEYFDRLEVLGVLGEWHRILRPGGVLRLAVPDFQALISVYRKAGSLAVIHGPLYGRMVVDNQVMYHKTVYDFPSLSAILLSCGFKSIRRWDWRETEHADVDDFSQAYWPHMEKENGILISLNVEASRA